VTRRTGVLQAGYAKQHRAITDSPTQRHHLSRDKPSLYMGSSLMNPDILQALQVLK
jgi:hypothetical protein